jgi:hypothetical protein
MKNKVTLYNGHYYYVGELNLDKGYGIIFIKNDEKKEEEEEEEEIKLDSEIKSELKRITGFDKTVSTKTDGQGNFALAVCFLENGQNITPWDVEQGTFDYCKGIYMGLHKVQDSMGLDFVIYTILYKLNSNNQPIAIVNWIEQGNKTYRDWLQIDNDDLEPLDISEHL